MGAFKFHLKTGNDIRSEYINAEPIIIGSSPQADLRVEHKDVSEKHLLVESKGDQTLITDQNTKLGTFLNGKKLDAGKPTPCKPTDEIRLGRTGPTLTIAIEIKSRASEVLDIFEMLEEKANGATEFYDTKKIAMKIKERPSTKSTPSAEAKIVSLARTGLTQRIAGLEQDKEKNETSTQKTEIAPEAEVKKTEPEPKIMVVAKVEETPKIEIPAPKIEAAKKEEPVQEKIVPPVLVKPEPVKPPVITVMPKIEMKVVSPPPIQQKTQPKVPISESIINKSQKIRAEIETEDLREKKNEVQSELEEVIRTLNKLRHNVILGERKHAELNLAIEETQKTCQKEMNRLEETKTNRKELEDMISRLQIDKDTAERSLSLTYEKKTTADEMIVGLTARAREIVKDIEDKESTIDQKKDQANSYLERMRTERDSLKNEIESLQHIRANILSNLDTLKRVQLEQLETIRDRKRMTNDALQARNRVLAEIGNREKEKLKIEQEILELNRNHQKTVGQYNIFKLELDEKLKMAVKSDEAGKIMEKEISSLRAVSEELSSEIATFLDVKGRQAQELESLKENGAKEYQNLRAKTREMEQKLTQLLKRIQEAEELRAKTEQEYFKKAA